jgi:hypothetical protein
VSSDTAPPVRATRCSTTAVSAAISPEYTVDRNPYKHGRFTPGTRIPIHDPAQIDKDRPDVVLALPWNLETELTEQLSYISEWGGQLVFPLPTLHTAAIPNSENHRR